MRRFGMLAAVTMAMAVFAGAQAPAPVAISPGTEIKAELRTAVDTAHAKPGARVEAITTAEVKVQGAKLLARGSHLFGTVVAVTPAESSKSPAHITILFTQAKGKHGLIMSLNAVITQVQRVVAAVPAMLQQPPPMQTPQQTGMDRPDGRQTATLGAMQMPSQITGNDQNMSSMEMRSRLQPITIRKQPGKGSVLTSRGNFKLDRGTQLRLQQQKPVAGDQPDAGNQ